MTPAEPPDPPAEHSGTPAWPPRTPGASVAQPGGGPSPVPPGTGWPGDPASAATPVARTAAEARELAFSARSLHELAAMESVCRACPRLVAWREQVAVTKRRSFQAERYWGRPVPGWGAQPARILIVGLAPAAHGGNRTGRIFTGDRSGDVLFASLWRSGLAAQPTSVLAGDGQRLIGTWMSAAVRCAPPGNKPTVGERDACAPWLAAELGQLLPDLRVIISLGHFAWQVAWQQLGDRGLPLPRPRPAFGHGVESMLPVSGGLLVLGCYHPSQQNTFTGRVTDAMLDAVFTRARQHSGL
jgi:uracil-DNA glycosylase family 4